jgi:hypothetical protein
MPVWRRLLCVAIGAGLLYVAARILLFEYEAGRFLIRATVPAVFMAFAGAFLFASGAFPKLTRKW